MVWVDKRVHIINNMFLNIGKGDGRVWIDVWMDGNVLEMVSYRR